MMKRLEYSKICPECKNNFDARRLNHVYCDDGCKNMYNNRNTLQQYHEQKQQDADVVVSDVHKILLRNRMILKKYIGQTVAFKTLEAEGFLKNYITEYAQIKTDRLEFICYDIIYDFTNDEKLTVSPYKIV